MLKEIDIKYMNHKQKMNDCILNKVQIFDAQWSVGLIDGDAYFGLRMIFNKNSVRFYPCFSLCMEVDAVLTLDMFASKFNKVGTKIIRRNSKKEATSIELAFSGEDVKELLDFCKRNPLFNKVKCAQVDLLNLFFLFKKNDFLDDYTKVYELINGCYDVNLLGKSRGRLKYSRETALKLLLDAKKPF